MQQDPQQNQIKHRILKLNLVQYIERHKYIFIALSYFIILSIINMYFISYTESINKTLINKTLINKTLINKSVITENPTNSSNSINLMSPTLFNTIKTNTILLNNLYKCLYTNAICIFCSFGVSMSDFISINANAKQSNGIETNKKETLVCFLMFLNFMIKTILSFKIIYLTNTEKVNEFDKLRSFTESLIVLSYLTNFVFGGLVLLTCCLEILCIFFRFILKVFI